MRKKTARSRSLTPDNLNQHYVAPDDLFFHARAFHQVSKALAASFQPVPSLCPGDNVSPVLFMYRHSIELYLKAIALGGGGNFLPDKPDPISIGKTHSLPWLTQFVCQIISALKWEDQFRCDGVRSLADFKAVVASLNLTDPGSYLYRLPVDPESATSIREFINKLDAVLDLLASIGDALEAESDLRRDGIEAAWDRGGSKQTIQ